MIVRRLNECAEFLAGDHTRLSELLHPDRAPVKIGYSVAHGHLAPGADSKRHRLSSTEVYYFLAGRGMFHIGGHASPVEPGMGRLCITRYRTVGAEFRRFQIGILMPRRPGMEG